MALSCEASVSSPIVLIFSTSLKKYGGTVSDPVDCFIVSVTAFLPDSLPPSPTIPDLIPAIPPVKAASNFKNARLPPPPLPELNGILKLSLSSASK